MLIFLYKFTRFFFPFKDDSLEKCYKELGVEKNELLDLSMIFN